MSTYVPAPNLHSSTVSLSESCFVACLRRKLVWKSEVYDSLQGVSALKLLEPLSCRLSIKKLNPVLLLPQAAAWTVRREEGKRAVRGLLFLSPLDMYITGSEAFFNVGCLSV